MDDSDAVGKPEELGIPRFSVGEEMMPLWMGLDETPVDDNAPAPAELMELGLEVRARTLL